MFRQFFFRVFFQRRQILREFSSRLFRPFLSPVFFRAFLTFLRVFLGNSKKTSSLLTMTSVPFDAGKFLGDFQLSSRSFAKNFFRVFFQRRQILGEFSSRPFLSPVFLDNSKKLAAYSP
jgi:hypothetical protein